MRQSSDPSMGDYLSFGRLIGDKPADTLKQLTLNQIAAREDEQSRSFLEE